LQAIHSAFCKIKIIINKKCAFCRKDVDLKCYYLYESKDGLEQTIFGYCEKHSLTGKTFYIGRYVKTLYHPSWGYLGNNLEDSIKKVLNLEKFKMLI
jgi:hypothetical protein